MVGDVINDILVEPSAPIVAGQDNPAAIRARPGGSAANQAAWLGWLLSPGGYPRTPRTLPPSAPAVTSGSVLRSLRLAATRRRLDVVFAGRAGAGDADYHQAELARFGVRARLAVDEGAATGSIVVLVGADGERTFITDRGANLRLAAADVPAALLDDAVLLHLTGYSFFDPGPRAVALGLIARARSRGIPFSVDPGSAAFLAGLEPGEFLRWTAGAAVCFPNRDEAAVLAGPAGMLAGNAGAGPAVTATAADRAADLTADPAALAASLTRHYGAVVVKLGPDGALLAIAGAEPARFPAHPAVVRDTTGAGDAFCAGFLAAWLTPASLPREGDPAGDALTAAMDAGGRAAAIAVSTLGGRPEP